MVIARRNLRAPSSHAGQRCKKKREVPIAVQVYRDVRRRFPAQELWDGIAKEVGTDEPSLAFWREVLQAWVARGYNPMNVKGPLDWFKKREIPQNGSSTPAEPKSERRPVESLEVIQARMQQNAIEDNIR